MHNWLVRGWGMTIYAVVIDFLRIGILPSEVQPFESFSYISERIPWHTLTPQPQDFSTGIPETSRQRCYRQLLQVEDHVS